MFNYFPIVCLQIALVCKPIIIGGGLHTKLNTLIIIVKKNGYSSISHLYNAC